MRIRWSWLAAAVLLLGSFVAMPDEGTAATKRTESLSLNFTKIEFRYEVEDKRTGLPIHITDLYFGQVKANAGPLGGSGPNLPVTPSSDVIAIDALGEAHGASQDVLYTGSPSSFPELSSFHFSMDFTKPGTMLRGMSSVMSIRHDPAAPGADKSYWQAEVEVQTDGLPAYPVSFIVEANPDQPGLSLKSVQTAQAPGFTPIASSFFDVFVELDYNAAAGAIDPSKPVVWLTVTGVPEPASAGLLLAVGGYLLRRRDRF